ncbi:hypothetical protein Aperf_G00000020394 [Anoplocephala perfoliata]
MSVQASIESLAMVAMTMTPLSFCRLDLLYTPGAWGCGDNDSAGQFVRMGCDVQQQRQHPHSSAQHHHHHQRSSGANQRKALAAAVANADVMTQSLIDWPGCDDTSSASSNLQRQQQQQRICQRMKAVHLTDSGLVLSPQDAASLPVYHHGRRIFFSSSSSNTTSPGDVPPGGGGGFFFQSQVSCPPHLGGKVNADDAVWTDGRVFEYQTAPVHAYPGHTYMVWPQHQLVSGQRRRRHQNSHHHPTQPIIVPAGDDDPFLMEKRSTSTKVAVPHSGRPQVLVAGHNRGKKAADLSTLVSLPVEEQPWFHGRLPRAEAESLLRSAPPGSFLVRTSETSKAAFSLSIRRDRDFLHMKISYDPKSEAFILGEYSQPYPTVPIMVHHYTRNLLPVRGTKPVLLKRPDSLGGASATQLVASPFVFLELIHFAPLLPIDVQSVQPTPPAPISSSVVSFEDFLRFDATRIEREISEKAHCSCPGLFTTFEDIVRSTTNFSTLNVLNQQPIVDPNTVVSPSD